jgi:hypothetical protein
MYMDSLYVAMTERLTEFMLWAIMLLMVLCHACRLMSAFADFIS